MSKKIIDRRAFMKRCGMALVGLGLTRSAFASDPNAGSVVQTGFELRKNLELLDPSAPDTLPQARWDAVARSAHDARKACLSVRDRNDKFCLTAFVVRLGGRYYLATANHGLGRYDDLETFSFVAENNRVVALCRDEEGLKRRRSLEQSEMKIRKADTIVIVGDNRLYLGESEGDLTVFELPEGGIPGVYSLDRNAIYYTPVDSKVRLLGMWSGENVVEPRDCVLKEIDHRNNNDLKVLRLVTENNGLFVRGDSGAPLVLADGSVVGMCIQLYRPGSDKQSSRQGIAASIDAIFNAVAKNFNYGYLGASLADEDDLTVANVAPGSPAYRSGIRKGDEIVALDGVAVLNLRQFQRYIAKLGPRKMVVSFKRGGAINRVAVDLIPVPA